MDRIIDIEGPDGVGKSTAIDAVAEACAIVCHGSIFKVIDFEKTHQRLPSIADLNGAGVLIVAEPTYSPPTGTAIRDRLLQRARSEDRPGTTMEDALMRFNVEEEVRLFAEDRERLYRDLVLPFLEQGHGWVVKSRGLASSIAYQAPRLRNLNTVQEGIDRILAHSGNQLELTHAPRALIILDLDPLEARKRMENRPSLDRFEENFALQNRVRSMYLSPELRNTFESRGTHVQLIDALQDKEAIKAQIARILTDIL